MVLQGTLILETQHRSPHSAGSAHAQGLSPLWALAAPLLNRLVSILAWSLSFSESSLLPPPNSKGKNILSTDLSLKRNTLLSSESSPQPFKTNPCPFSQNKELLEQVVQKFQLHLLREYQYIICLDYDVCVCFDIYLFGCAGSYLWHVGSSSLGLNLGALLWEHGVLATGLPAKSL